VAFVAQMSQHGSYSSEGASALIRTKEPFAQ